MCVWMDGCRQTCLYAWMDGYSQNSMNVCMFFYNIHVYIHNMHKYCKYCLTAFGETISWQFFCLLHCWELFVVWYDKKEITVINLEVGWYSLEQNISWSCWQAFIFFCRLHQVWKVTGKHALIWSLKCLLSMLRGMLWKVRTLGEGGNWEMEN